MNLALVVAAVVLAAPAADELQRSGLYGWGLGVEVPVVGVMTGGGGDSRSGWGYTLGGALAYELTPTLLGRLFVGGGRTFGGRAPIRYVFDVQTSADKRRHGLDASWSGLEVTLGAAYLFRSPTRGWAPYVGADGGARYAGYDYRFDAAVENLEATAVVDPEDQCVGGDCRVIRHEAVGWGWEAALRGGIRLELASWLQAEPELQLVYTRAGGERVSNTIIHRDVRGVAQDVWLARATFSVRVGL